MPKVNILFDEYGEAMEEVRQERHPRASFQKKPLELHPESAFARMARSCNDAESIQKFLTENFKELIANAETRNAEIEGDYKLAKLHELEFALTNFIRVEGRYAYVGKLTIKCDENAKYNVRDAFADTCFNLGDHHDETRWERIQGGYQHVRRSFYDVCLFLEDWKGLSDQAAIDRLTGDNPLIEAHYNPKKSPW